VKRDATYLWLRNEIAANKLVRWTAVSRYVSSCCDCERGATADLGVNRHLERRQHELHEAIGDARRKEELQEFKDDASSGSAIGMSFGDLIMSG